MNVNTSKIEKVSGIQRGRWNKVSAFSFMMVILAFSCSSTSKEEAVETNVVAGWTVTITGKVLNPQAGQISIVELNEGSTGKPDTIRLRKDNTFIKKVTLSQP